MKTLSILTIALAILLTGCKEFIEPSITKKNVVLLAPANRAKRSQYSLTFWWEFVENVLKCGMQVVTPDFNQTLILDTLLASNKLYAGFWKLLVGMGYFFEMTAQYTEGVECETNIISSLLEPLIIIFLGLVVGVIVIAMYLLMFQMSNSF